MVAPRIHRTSTSSQSGDLKQEHNAKLIGDEAVTQVSVYFLLNYVSITGTEPAEKQPQQHTAPDSE